MLPDGKVFLEDDLRRGAFVRIVYVSENGQNLVESLTVTSRPSPS